MRALGLLLLAVTLFPLVVLAEPSGKHMETPEVTQTARQALLEMFFSKSPGTIMKHLPAATQAVLEKAGSSAGLNQYAMVASQLQAQQKNLQTFETGSVLLTYEDPKNVSKVEVTVENDSLLGDQDDIELSFRNYKNGIAQRTPFMPHLTCSMKMEAGTWKLNEITVTVRLPLADPDLLKSMGEAIKAQSERAASSMPSATLTTSTPGFTPVVQVAGNDTAVVAAMRSILSAETTYAATYRATGYTCTLSDLDGFGGGERNEHQAMLISAGLAGGKRYGYVFALSQCGGSPASSFQLTAAPSGNAFGRRAYCADQSGAIRYSADGNPANCKGNGTLLP
ncbi:MAG: hypothetical protein WB729_14585 [Candidatus Sulfotelmatobacter sp.]